MRAILQVKKFNGTEIRNVKHLVWLVQRCKDEYFHWEFDRGDAVVLKADEARKSTETVVSTHNLPHSMSPDLKAAADSWSDNGAEPPIHPAAVRAEGETALAAVGAHLNSNGAGGERPPADNPA